MSVLGLSDIVVIEENARKCVGTRMFNTICCLGAAVKGLGDLWNTDVYKTG
jgi:hypothetical protein